MKMFHTTIKTHQMHKFYPGSHEAEMCYGGEADLHRHVLGCKKNPGHKDFIPLKDFCRHHLPPRYHDDDLLVETVKAQAAITVQIKTKFTSLVRPEFYPGTQVSYPCHADRGSHVIRMATGRVYGIVKYTQSDTTCQCMECQVSDTPSTVWGEVYVMTSTHVVFDESEARRTRCVFGFDDTASSVVNLDGWNISSADVERDWCVLKRVTCDLKFLNELDTMWRRFDYLRGKVKNKYWNLSDVDKLTIIVSHPHGCPKQVSVGQWTHRYVRDGLTKYTYTTCTCPGSSGSTVYANGLNGWLSHLHCGSSVQGNYSAEMWC
ncbi:uncharacterized protein LOC131938688 [Physella acuta]|uniref:uncharacterized protein LOC131938688 n=1 Tax=Physella acuta TaxID=109671 RepID=UPI0027DB3277|nr:uncharacterized protein LOC131938688 [Physella acuta]